MKDREDKSRQLADLREKLAAFNMLSLTQKEPVKVWTEATEPDLPKSPPNRGVLYIAVCTCPGLGLGLALVCFLEHRPTTLVKVPEHLTMGLGLPLFGRRPPDAPQRQDPPRRPPLDLGHARLDRGRRLPEPPGIACSSSTPEKIDQIVNPARHQRQGRRG